MVEKIKAETLESYLIDASNQPAATATPGALYSSETKVYPNPLLSEITIIAKSELVDNQDIFMNVYYLTGRSVLSKTLQKRKSYLY